jgi:hypothetical protein
MNIGHNVDCIIRILGFIINDFIQYRLRGAPTNKKLLFVTQIYISLFMENTINDIVNYRPIIIVILITCLLPMYIVKVLERI